ncbi:MAG: asparagine synthase (glutamine-hydrolyzing) [Chloroflexota bacterium]|nr:asparagine synthase (glutamine-hydrolyzing) [Chloroflexota bacterium]
MCGIFGFSLVRELDTSDVEIGLKQLDSLSHRGPDGCGHEAFHKQGVFIGHRRLAILDTSDRASQPMSRDRFTVAHNGEIYNFLELREILKKKGFKFTTDSDTEVLINAWRNDGVGCLQELDGMFAFALFDGEATNLVTDPFGEKPLYLAQQDEGVYYASEPAALIELLGLRFEPTEYELAAFLTLGFIPAPGTGFKNLQRVEPGSHVVITKGKITRAIRYWTPTEPVLPGGELKPASESQIDVIADSLIESLKVRLRSDVPMSIFLSSGVDSALIAAIAAKELNTDIPTITVGFDGTSVPDESVSANAIANYLGLDHQVIRGDRTGGADALDLLVDLYGCPNDNITAIPSFDMANTVRSSATVALAGIGGDELFYGYNKYQYFYDHSGVLSLPRSLRTITRWLSNITRHTTAFDSLRRSKQWTYANYKNVGIWDLLERISGLEQWGDEFFSEYSQPQFVAARHFDLTHVLPGSYIPAIELSSMRVALEVRTPFLNRDLLAKVDGLDPRSLVEFGQKSIARRILNRYVPDHLIPEGKRGFIFPLDQIIESQTTFPRVSGIERDIVADSMSRRYQGRGGQLFLRMMVLDRIATAA